MAWLKVQRFLTANPKEMASQTCEELYCSTKVIVMALASYIMRTIAGIA
jgi:hypothetical protein